MELFRIGGPNPDTNYLFMGQLHRFTLIMSLADGGACRRLC